MSALDEQELYALSLEREPRGLDLEALENLENVQDDDTSKASKKETDNIRSSGVKKEPDSLRISVKKKDANKLV